MLKGNLINKKSEATRKDSNEKNKWKFEAKRAFWGRRRDGWENMWPERMN